MLKISLVNKKSETSNVLFNQFLEKLSLCRKKNMFGHVLGVGMGI